MDLLTHITLAELRYILAVSEELNFNKAADKCFVSQPTLSIAIKKLENSLGVSIFERNKNSVIITDIGSKIIVKAKQVINLISEIQFLAKSTDNPYSYRIKIGAIHTVGPYIFPTIIDWLNKEQSEIKLIIEENYTDTLYQQLLNANLDVIIVAAPFDYPNIKTIHLYNEPLDLIIPKDHKWTKRKSINPKDLINETLLLLNKGNCFRDQVLALCPYCNTSNETSNMIATTSLETIKYMVMRNMGVTIIPRSAIDSKHPNYQVKPFTKPIPQREIILAYRNGFPYENILQELSRVIASCIFF
ncbi:MAG: hydrogen peroxide-inducible genes activator [Neisseriaceae bacterium]